MVEDLNIKRRAVYSEKAQAAGATIEEYAFTSGCRLITQTAPGEKYEGPAGTWLTRTSAPPQRDARFLYTVTPGPNSSTANPAQARHDAPPVDLNRPRP